MERMNGLSSRVDFDALKIDKQIKRGELGGEFNGGIQERQGASWAVHRGGFVDFGA